MSDHAHYEYADARHDHRGDYAPDRHDHDLEYAEKQHRHHDLEREGQSVAGFVDTLRREVVNLRRELDHVIGDLRDAQKRIQALEADQAAADLAGSESWRGTLAGYAVASGAAEYDDEDGDREEAGGQPFAAVPRLRRVTCTRTVWTDGNPEPCGLPVDHDPDEKCPGNPHARPAPEASQP